MHRLLVLGIGLVLVVGCDSSSKPDRPKLTKEEKAAKNEKDLDDQLVDPPADVVAALGAPVYPGAKSMKAIASMRSEANGIVSTDYVFFLQEPAASKVREFYESKLTNPHRGDPVMEKMNTYVVKGTNANGDEVSVQARDLGDRTNFHFVVSKKK